MPDHVGNNVVTDPAQAQGAVQRRHEVRCRLEAYIAISGIHAAGGSISTNCSLAPRFEQRNIAFGGVPSNAGCVLG